MLLLQVLFAAIFVSIPVGAYDTLPVTWAVQFEEQLSRAQSFNHKPCFRKTMCHNFLDKMEADDKSDKLFGSDYSHTCQIPDDSAETIVSLEINLREDTKKWLGDTNFYPGHCANSSDNSQATKKSRSRYYYSLLRLAQTQQQVVQQMGLTQKMLGQKPFGSIACENLSYPKSVEICQRLKTDCDQKSPQEINQKLEVMASRTESVLKSRASLQNEIKPLRSQLMGRGLNENQKQDLARRIAEKEKSLHELEAQAPWVLGEGFQKAIADKKSYKESIRAQLQSNQENFQQYINDSEWATRCFKGFEKDCDIEKIRRILESSVAAEPENLKSLQKLRLADYYSQQRCIQAARIHYTEMNDTVRGAFIDAGLAALGLLTAGGTTAAASERFLLRTLGNARAVRAADKTLKGLELSGNSVHTYSQFQQAQEACRDMVGLKKSNAESKLTCEVESLQESPSVMKNYTSCLQQAQLFFATSSVFSIAAFKATFLGSKASTQTADKLDIATAQKIEDSNLTAIQKQTDQARKRAGDFSGTEARRFSHASISGFQGKVIAENPKISSLPKLESMDIKLVKVQGLDGVETLHYRDVVKLENGTWVNRWPEVRVDPATGFLDANFPGGRNLFEKIAKESDGKAHLAFIDLGNLGAINMFAAGTEAGDAFLKSVSKIIIEKSNGKVSAARLGGDELGLIIHESDPEKSKALLKEIVEAVRARGSEPRKIFDEQKKHLVAEAKAASTFDELQERQQQVIEFGKIQMPDLSVGLAKLTSGGSFSDHLSDAEKMATEMKIPNKLVTGLPAKKYGSFETPSRTSRPYMQNYDVKIAPERNSASASDVATYSSSTASAARDIQMTPNREIKRFGNMSLVEYKDEAGDLSYRVEKYFLDLKTGQRTFVSREVPLRGPENLFDGLHPEAQNLALGQFFTSTEPDRALIMLKLRSLRYLNYFSSGTNTGDQMLSVVAQELKNQLKRDTDLKMKLGGADFMATVENMKPEQAQQLEKKLQKAVQENPVAKNILKREKEALTAKVKQAQTKAQNENDPFRKSALQREVQDLKDKLNQVESFNFQLELQSVRPDQVGETRTFDGLRRQLESQFSK